MSSIGAHLALVQLLAKRLQASAQAHGPASATGNKDLQQIDDKAAEQRARLADLHITNHANVPGPRSRASDVCRGRDWPPTPVDKHADIDDLAVPDERRPSLRAPIRKLFGYLIRALLRKWAKRLEKAKS